LGLYRRRNRGAIASGAFDAIPEAGSEAHDRKKRPEGQEDGPANEDFVRPRLDKMAFAPFDAQERLGLDHGQTHPRLRTKALALSAQKIN